MLPGRPQTGVRERTAEMADRRNGFRIRSCQSPICRRKAAKSCTIVVAGRIEMTPSSCSRLKTRLTDWRVAPIMRARLACVIRPSEISPLSERSRILAKLDEEQRQPFADLLAGQGLRQGRIGLALEAETFDQGNRKGRRQRDQPADRALVEMQRLDVAERARRPAMAVVAEHVRRTDEIARVPRREHQFAPLRTGEDAFDRPAEDHVDAVGGLALPREVFAILMGQRPASLKNQVEVRLRQRLQQIAPWLCLADICARRRVGIDRRLEPRRHTCPPGRHGPAGRLRTPRSYCNAASGAVLTRSRNVDAGGSAIRRRPNVICQAPSRCKTARRRLRSPCAAGAWAADPA